MYDFRPGIVDDREVLHRAAHMSTAINHHLFDTLYHAVALEKSADLVTADEVYLNKARRFGGIIRLADFAGL